jgi:hypothetical protein
MALAGPSGTESPSSAFLAGQQHGTKLAIQHATPGMIVKSTHTGGQIVDYGVNPNAKPGASKVLPTPASPTRKPAAVSSTVPTLNSVLAQAHAMAAGDTAAQVGAYKAQQNTYNTQAQDRANQINLASQAAAKFLSGIGDTTAASYNNAAQILAGIAGGYSGDLKNTATDAAAAQLAQLAQLGAPAGSLKTATGETANPQALSNVLYGLGGAIPANLLVSSGQAQAAAQRGLPASMLGYGQQQALGTLAAGQQQADTLTPQIIAARAGLPKLVQQYLTAIQSQQTNTALANSLIQNRDTTAGIAQQNADTNATRATNTYTIAQQKLAASKQPKPLTPAAAAKLATLAGTLYNGVAPSKQFNTQTQTWMNVPGTGQQPAHWATAVARLMASGASAQQAQKLLIAQGWQPGEGGRPLSAAQKKTNAAVKSGLGIPKLAGPFAGLGG